MLSASGREGSMAPCRENLHCLTGTFEFASLYANACFERLCVIVYSLIRDLVPVKHPTVRRPPWPTRPPGSLLRSRSVSWDNYKSTRRIHGRRSVIAVEALSQFNSINADIHTFHIRSHAQYESSLIHRMKENPKLFHAYIRHKKKQVAHQLAHSFYHLVSWVTPLSTWLNHFLRHSPLSKHPITFLIQPPSSTHLPPWPCWCRCGTCWSPAPRPGTFHCSWSWWNPPSGP